MGLSIQVTLFFLLSILSSSFAYSTPECSDFDPQNIKLVTVDVFAALTLLEDSLIISFTKILPDASSEQIEFLKDSWLEVYVDHMGLNFDINVTGPQPFIWMLNSSLPSILQQANISISNSSSYDELIYSWGHLIPRPDAISTFSYLTEQGYQVGPLSNGAKDILEIAFSALYPAVSPSFIFSSDYPVMCFKHCPKIYQTVLDVSNYTNMQVLHVAGSFYDAEGARAAGLFSAVLAPGETTNSSLAEPCFVLQTLSDLIDIL